jgi:hypothetical protein
MHDIEMHSLSDGAGDILADDGCHRGRPLGTCVPPGTIVRTNTEHRKRGSSRGHHKATRHSCMYRSRSCGLRELESRGDTDIEADDRIGRSGFAAAIRADHKAASARHLRVQPNEGPPVRRGETLRFSYAPIGRARCSWKIAHSRSSARMAVTRCWHGLRTS